MDDSLAVVGLSCRVPGADDIRKFWSNLVEGICSVTPLDGDLDPSIPPSVKNDPRYVTVRGRIRQADCFDHDFFGFSPREAQLMDPQHRLFLEECWNALEDAACDPDRFPGLIGVYGGTGFNTYFSRHLANRPEVTELMGEHQIQLLNGPDYLAGRAAYCLNLQGPAVSVYTGCSTSLVAVIQACESLWSHQCDLALAGAGFVQCPLNAGYLYREGEVFSKDGSCRPFDAEANGIVFSDGVGVVALRRTVDAVRDGDPIYARIMGTGLNNDGRERVSFTSPGVKTQARAIRDAQEHAGVGADSISYIEAHGAGSNMGDPIEFKALRNAFKQDTERTGYCCLGSVKGNLGHLDAAAGVAGLIKTCLALKHQAIPATLNFRTPNPEIDLDSSPFFISTEHRRWESPRPLRAGVSSLGIGGTNAHVVLEEHVAYAPPPIPEPTPRPLLLSAKSKAALQRRRLTLARYLEDHPETRVDQLCHTLQAGRSRFEHRLALTVETISQAVTGLGDLGIDSANCTATERPLVFLFPGFGSQTSTMGCQLYQQESVFRSAVKRCSQIAADFVLATGWKVEDHFARAMWREEHAQLLLFVTEFALAEFWMSLGLRPELVAGHSLGEYAAATLAGIFSLEEALRLIVRREALTQRLPEGAMLAVFQSAAEVSRYLGPGLDLAAVNGPGVSVLSGTVEKVDNLSRRLAEEGVRCRKLHTTRAFHSAQLDSIMDEFAEVVDSVPKYRGELPLVSCLTGRLLQGEHLDTSYWLSHFRETVRFDKCLSTLLENEEYAYLEVGPGQVLRDLSQAHPSAKPGHAFVSSFSHPKEEFSEQASVVRAMGSLWVAGVSIDREAFRGQNVPRLSLPGYPFERVRHWIEAPRRNDEASRLEPVSTEDGNGTQNPESDFEWQLDDETQNRLGGLFYEILGSKSLGSESCFYRLGGTSLSSVRLLVRIEEVFGVSLSLSTLESASTIERLSDEITSRKLDSSWQLASSGSSRIANFAAGPAALPQPVLEEARAHLQKLPGADTSVLEIDHRSQAFRAILARCQNNLRALLGIPDDYHILFLQGGASLQFSMLALNFLPGRFAYYSRTGAWSKRAMLEGAKHGEVRLHWDGKPWGFTRMPNPGDFALQDEAAYLHFTSNETLEGIQLQGDPEPGRVPLVCDATSDILSKPINIDRYAMIYSSAQKNAGTAGVTLVVIKDAFLKSQVCSALPTMLDYRAIAEDDSLFNTPPCFAIYMVELTTRWLLEEVGGLHRMAALNKQKSTRIYSVVDESQGFYRGLADPAFRSQMNVVFALPSEALEKKFVEQAAGKGLIGLKGHHLMGHLRASLYNAVGLEEVERLADFMICFEKENR